MYYYIYVTKIIDIDLSNNSINEFYYVGKHQDKEIDNRYVGSGNIVTELKKFVKETDIQLRFENGIHTVTTKDEIDQVEREVIEQYVEKYGSRCLNLMYRPRISPNPINVVEFLKEKYLGETINHRPDWNTVKTVEYYDNRISANGLLFELDEYHYAHESVLLMMFDVSNIFHPELLTKFNSIIESEKDCKFQFGINIDYGIVFIQTVINDKPVVWLLCDNNGSLGVYHYSGTGQVLKQFDETTLSIYIGKKRLVKIGFVENIMKQKFLDAINEEIKTIDTKFKTDSIRTYSIYRRFSNEAHTDESRAELKSLCETEVQEIKARYEHYRKLLETSRDEMVNEFFHEDSILQLEYSYSLINDVYIGCVERFKKLKLELHKNNDETCDLIRKRYTDVLDIIIDESDKSEKYLTKMMNQEIGSQLNMYAVQVNAMAKFYNKSRTGLLGMH